MKIIKRLRISSLSLIISLIALILVVSITIIIWSVINTNSSLYSFLFDVVNFNESYSSIYFVSFFAFFSLVLILSIIFLTVGINSFKKNLVNPNNVKFNYWAFMFPSTLSKINTQFIFRKFYFIEDSLNSNDRVNIEVKNSSNYENNFEDSISYTNEDLLFQENNMDIFSNDPVKIFPMQENRIVFENKPQYFNSDTSEFDYVDGPIYDTNIIFEDEEMENQEYIQNNQINYNDDPFQFQNENMGNTFEQSFQTNENFYNNLNNTQYVNQNFRNDVYENNQIYRNFYSNNPNYKLNGNQNYSNMNTQYIDENISNLNQNLWNSTNSQILTPKKDFNIPNINSLYKGSDPRERLNNNNYVNPVLNTQGINPFINPRTGKRIAHPYVNDIENANTKQVHIQKQLFTIEFLYKSGQISPSEYYVRRNKIISNQ